MKLLVYGVGNWDSQEQAEILKPEYNEWLDRVRAFLGDPEIFLSAGSYSDPKFNPLNIELVQLNIPKTKNVDVNWNYFRVGFMTGIYHALFNPGWDLLVHCQCRTLIGKDIIPILNDFLKTSDLICAPKWTASHGISVEVGFMAMKPDAVKKYATSALRQSLTEANIESDNELNVEKECYKMFMNSWYDPFPEIFSTRKRSAGWHIDGDRDFELDINEFLRSTIIAGTKHCSKAELKLWCKEHPVVKHSKGLSC